MFSLNAFHIKKILQKATLTAHFLFFCSWCRFTYVHANKPKKEIKKESRFEILLQIRRIKKCTYRREDFNVDAQCTDTKLQQSQRCIYSMNFQSKEIEQKLSLRDAAAGFNARKREREKKRERIVNVYPLYSSSFFHCIEQCSINRLFFSFWGLLCCGLLGLKVKWISLFSLFFCLKKKVLYKSIKL